MKNTIKLMLTAIIIVIVTTIFVGCSDVSITGMTVSQEQVEMVIGETFTPEIELEFDNAEASQEQIDAAIEAAGITWTSSDEDVAKVIDGGIEAVGSGEAEVTVSDSTGNFSVVIGVIVAELATDIDVDEDTIELFINGEDSVNVNASVLPAGSSCELTYSSSDETIATVSEDGEVTAVANGEVKISISLTVDGLEITVKSIDVIVTTVATEVGMDNTAGWIYVGSSYQLTPFAVPTEAVAEYTFASDNESVAIVAENGSVTGKSTGTANIVIADNFGNEVTYVMTVKAVPVYTAPSNNSSGGSTGSSGGGTTGGSTASGGGTTAPAAPAPAPAAPAAPAPVTPAAPAPTPPPTNYDPGTVATPGDGTNGGQWAGE